MSIEQLIPPDLPPLQYSFSDYKQVKRSEQPLSSLPYYSFHNVFGIGKNNFQWSWIMMFVYENHLSMGRNQ